MHERTVDERRLLLIEVPIGAVVHATTSGSYRWRVEDRCEPIGPDTMRSIAAARGTYDWSGELSGVGPDAIVATASSAGSEGTVLLRREDARRRPLVLLIEDVLGLLAGVAQTDAFRVGAAEVRLVD
ncbi:MAG: hypothetical protein M3071_05180 [Actinomycetota bacterium]|nr:hypothetical protein [Actinomycetota bacterium]